MGRHKSPIRVKRRSKGFDFQPRDKERLSFIARWYCVSPMHLLRREEDINLWHPMWHKWEGDQAERDRVILTRLNGLRRRMLYMRRIQPHPPVAAENASATTIGYYATQFGGAMVSPWANIRPAAFQNIAHSFMATDIGMQLERSGFRVYSEREVATRTTVHGRPISNPLASTFNPGQGGSPTTKTPDLVVPSRSTENFIAIEIERDENRPLRVYREKLRAYQSNPHIHKVWYCYREGTNTGQRVHQAAHELWGDSYTSLVRLVPCVLRRGKLLPEDADPEAIRAEDFYEIGSDDENENVRTLNAVFADLEALK